MTHTISENSFLLWAAYEGFLCFINASEPKQVVWVEHWQGQSSDLVKNAWVLFFVSVLMMQAYLLYSKSTFIYEVKSLQFSEFLLWHNWICGVFAVLGHSLTPSTVQELCMLKGSSPYHPPTPRKWKEKEFTGVSTVVQWSKDPAYSPSGCGFDLWPRSLG